MVRCLLARGTGSPGVRQGEASQGKAGRRVKICRYQVAGGKRVLDRYFALGGVYLKYTGPGLVYVGRFSLVPCQPYSNCKRNCLPLLWGACGEPHGQRASFVESLLD